MKHFAASKISKDSNHQLKKHASYGSFNHYHNERIESNLHRHSKKIRSFNKSNNSFESPVEHL